METKIKRRMYIFFAIILGMLLGVIVEALIERNYISSLLSRGASIPAQYSSGFFLSPTLLVIFLLAGAALGYVLGVRWWRLVYVEKRHWRMRKNKKEGVE